MRAQPQSWPATVLAVLLFCAVPGQFAGAAPAATLGHPGLLVIVGAADSSAGFRWQAGPGPRQRSLVWPEGVLTVPADRAGEPFGADDLAFAVTAALAGVGGGGRLAFASGRFDVSQPLHLTDGGLAMYVAAGELEILSERIRYRRPRAGGVTPDPRAGFLLLGGMALLVMVFLRLARRRGDGIAAP